MTDVLSPHSKILISRTLRETGHWCGIRRGVRLAMTLDTNLLGRMIICDFKRGRKCEQVTGRTVSEIAEELRVKLRRKI